MVRQQLKLFLPILLFTGMVDSQLQALDNYRKRGFEVFKTERVQEKTGLTTLKHEPPVPAATRQRG